MRLSTIIRSCRSLNSGKDLEDKKALFVEILAIFKHGQNIVTDEMQLVYFRAKIVSKVGLLSLPKHKNMARLATKLHRVRDILNPGSPNR